MDDISHIWKKAADLAVLLGGAQMAASESKAKKPSKKEIKAMKAEFKAWEDASLADGKRWE